VSSTGQPTTSASTIPGVSAASPVNKQQIQVRVEQASADPFQRQSSPAAFTNDLQYGCGVSHLAYLTVLVDR
jgi:hypothetical protein